MHVKNLFHFRNNFKLFIPQKNSRSSTSAIKTWQFIVLSPFCGDDRIPLALEQEDQPLVETKVDFSNNPLLGHLTPEDFRDLQELMWFYGHTPHDGSYKALHSMWKWKLEKSILAFWEYILELAVPAWWAILVCSIPIILLIAKLILDMDITGGSARPARRRLAKTLRYIFYFDMLLAVIPYCGLTCDFLVGSDRVFEICYYLLDWRLRREYLPWILPFVDTLPELHYLLPTFDHAKVIQNLLNAQLEIDMETTEDYRGWTLDDILMNYHMRILNPLMEIRFFTVNPPQQINWYNGVRSVLGYCVPLISCIYYYYEAKKKKLF